MWCQQCQQDVRGVVTSGECRCVRCDTAIGGEAARQPAYNVGLEELANHGLDLSAVAASPAIADLDWDDWALEDELRRVQRMLSALPSEPKSLAARFGALSEHDLPMHNWSPMQSLPPMAQPAVKPAVQPQKSNTITTVAWTLLSLGVMAFVCGGIMLAWSYFGGLERLWHLGLPIALAGQAGLLLGFVLQLDRLRQDNTRPVATVESVDERNLDRTQTTARIGTAHGSASQAFYAHMAEGASPHILLADLKGQLDLLALRMAKG